MSRFFRIFSWVLVLAGAYLGWRGASDYYQSVHSQTVASLEWDNQMPEQASSDRNPVGTRPAALPGRAAPAPKGTSIARLSIPRLDATLYVLEGTDDNDLKRGPGHLEGTVMPGADGNCVIAGHRDTHFRVLRNIEKGDIIVVQSRQGSYRYRVSGLSVVTPDNTQCLQPTHKPVLNLVTCFPFEYVGSAPRRFVVHADLVSSKDARG